jgi:hypothetical protein
MVARRNYLRVMGKLQEGIDIVSGWPSTQVQ